MKIEFKSVLSEEMMLQGREWHWRKFGTLQHWWTVGGIVAILLGVTGLVGENPPLGFMLVGYGTYCVFRKFIIKRYSLREFRSFPSFGKEVKTTVSDDGILQEFDTARSELKWDVFYETVSTPDGFLLYLQKNQYIWLPLNDIEDDGDEPIIRGLLTRRPNR